MRTSNPIPHHCAGIYRTRSNFHAQSQSWKKSRTIHLDAVRLFHLFIFIRLVCWQIVNTWLAIAASPVVGDTHLVCRLRSKIIPLYIACIRLACFKRGSTSNYDDVGGSNLKNNSLCLIASGRYRKFVSEQQSKTGCAELASLLLQVRSPPGQRTCSLQRT